MLKCEALAWAACILHMRPVILYLPSNPCMATQQLSTNKCFQGTDLQRQLLKVLMLAG